MNRQTSQPDVPVVVDATKGWPNHYQGMIGQVPSDNLREHRPTLSDENTTRELPTAERRTEAQPSFNRCKNATFPSDKLEMTMRLKMITVLVPLFAALATQVAAAYERLQNSNAYAAPGEIVAPPDWTSYANGAMASGMAGH